MKKIHTSNIAASLMAFVIGAKEDVGVFLCRMPEDDSEKAEYGDKPILLDEPQYPAARYACHRIADVLQMMQDFGMGDATDAIVAVKHTATAIDVCEEVWDTAEEENMLASISNMGDAIFQYRQKHTAPVVVNDTKKNVAKLEVGGVYYADDKKTAVHISAIFWDGKPNDLRLYCADAELLLPKKNMGEAVKCGISESGGAEKIYIGTGKRQRIYAADNVCAGGVEEARRLLYGEGE
ncbi:MAG: hypothetical protein ACR2PR_11195 [Pseudohongiellaceae bacterium]